MSLAFAALGFSAEPKTGSGLKTLASYQMEADRFGSVLALPELETTPENVKQSISNTIAKANMALDQIGQLDAAKVSFRNTIQALDDIAFQASLAANRISLIKETSESAPLRDAATEMIKVFQEWAVGLDYREDVYAAVQAFAGRKPQLVGEDLKLFEETLRDYRRAGLQLPKAERDEVERLRKEVSRLETDFDANITKAQKPMFFTKDELDGVPDSLLNQPGIKTAENQYTVMANITFHFVAVMENAKKERLAGGLRKLAIRWPRSRTSGCCKRLSSFATRLPRSSATRRGLIFKSSPRWPRTARQLVNSSSN